MLLGSLLHPFVTPLGDFYRSPPPFGPPLKTESLFRVGECAVCAIAIMVMGLFESVSGLASCLPPRPLMTPYRRLLFPRQVLVRDPPSSFTPWSADFSPNPRRFSLSSLFPISAQARVLSHVWVSLRNHQERAPFQRVRFLFASPPGLRTCSFRSLLGPFFLCFLRPCNPPFSLACRRR